MNKSEDERFCELAHKAIAERAEAQELAELQTMLENPRWAEKFEVLKVEVALLKEALPLFEDVEHQDIAVPDMPLERLRDEVRGVFEQRSAARTRLDNLLAELPELVAGWSEGQRARLLFVLQRILRTGQRAPKTVALELETDVPESTADAAAAEESRRHRAEVRHWFGQEETVGVEAQLRVKLKTMEDRLSEALRHLSNCNDEARNLLNLIREERDSLGRRIEEKREKGS